MIQDETKPSEKKPYASPQLVVYGDVRLVTETKRTTGSDSGASPANQSK